MTMATVEPLPRRYWWLKRAAAAVVLLLAGLLLLRLWWGCVAERRYEAALARYQAEGAPFYLEDFRPAPIPEEENGAPLLRKAAEAVVLPPGNQAIMEYRQSASAAEFEAWLESNAQAFELVREARGRREVVWDLDAATAFKGGMRDIELGRLLTERASHQFAQGDSRASVASLLDALWVARSLGTKGSLLAVVSETLIATIVAEKTKAMLVHFAIEGESPNAATRRQTGELIGYLTDELHVRDNWRYAVLVERGWSASMVRDTLEDDLPPHARNSELSTIQRGMYWLYRPMIVLDAERLFDGYTLQAGYSAAASVPAARRLYPQPASHDGTAAENRARILSLFAMPDYSSPFENTIEDWTRSSLVGIALALRLYEIDHGQRTASLAALVPEYLPRVPIDLMAGDGREIAYVPGGAAPRIYSVGANGIDDGGKAASQPSRGRSRGGSDDIVFDLWPDSLSGSAFPASAPAAASSQAVSDHLDVEHQPGDAQRDQRDGDQP